MEEEELARETSKKRRSPKPVSHNINLFNFIKHNVLLFVFVLLINNLLQMEDGQYAVCDTCGALSSDYNVCTACGADLPAVSCYFDQTV